MLLLSHTRRLETFLNNDNCLDNETSASNIIAAENWTECDVHFLLLIIKMYLEEKRGDMMDERNSTVGMCLF